MRYCLLAMLMMLLSATSFAAPKNVIIMIADGWGYNHIEAVKLWSGQAQPYERYPVRLGMTTYALEGLLKDSLGYDPHKMWSDFDYARHNAGESASSGTAIATGVKVRKGEVAADTTNHRRLKSILERAEELGKSTGVVTSVPWSHATPAAFAAHDASRKNFAAIAIDMLDSSGCEVIMGCGHPEFDNDGKPTIPEKEEDYRYVGGVEKWAALRSGRAGGAMPFTLVQARGEFQKLMSGSVPPRVCGTAQSRETLQILREPREQPDERVPPYSVPLDQHVPTLAEMTRGALNVLDDNDRGFFLMVEGGAIDWAAHDKQLGRLIEEMEMFAAAVDSVNAWIENHGGWKKTLLIVTGDHETGYLWGPGSGKLTLFNALADSGKGRLPGALFYNDGHSNSLVPLFAKGNGAKQLDARAVGVDPARGRYLDNTDIGKTVMDLWKK